MVKKEIKNNDLILDISQYNIIKDYTKVKNLCSAAVLRVGYRGYVSGTIVKDKLFSQYVNELIDELPIGVYFLDQSINENEAILQANWTYIELLNAGLGATPIPIWLDSEASASKDKDGKLNHKGRGDLISKEQRTKNVLAFCNRMNELGYRAGIYASDSWLKDKLVYAEIKHLPVWNAKYNSNNGLIGTKPLNRADLHQFTSKYVTDFCNGPLDMSVVLKDSIFKKEELENVDRGCYPIPEFTLNECLAKIGLSTDFETKRKIALANGQPNYTGALNQNLKMLEWLNAGKLKQF